MFHSTGPPWPPGHALRAITGALSGAPPRLSHVLRGKSPNPLLEDKTVADSFKTITVHLMPDRSSNAAPGYVITATDDGTKTGALSSRESARLNKVLRALHRSVRLIDPIGAEFLRDGTVDLGHFPYLSISQSGLLMLYVAILAERDLVALGQVHWPDAITESDADHLESLANQSEDFYSAVQNFIWPRLFGASYSAPYEWLPYLPRGLPMPLRACSHPASHLGETPNGRRQYVLSCEWIASDIGLFSAPKVAWDAIDIASHYMGDFTKTIKRKVACETSVQLCCVEVFPQVSAFGLAALWLATLRHRNLTKPQISPKWPEIFADDLLYMETFGNDFTQFIVSTYLTPLLMTSRTAIQRVA